MNIFIVEFKDCRLARSDSNLRDTDFAEASESIFSPPKINPSVSYFNLLSPFSEDISFTEISFCCIFVHQFSLENGLFEIHISYLRKRAYEIKLRLLRLIFEYQKMFPNGSANPILGYWNHFLLVLREII